LFNGITNTPFLRGYLSATGATTKQFASLSFRLFFCYFIINSQHHQSLSGLESINPETIANLYITGNDSLVTCEVQSICNYLTNPNGTVIITGNAAGCNNPEEVQQACLTIVEEAKTEEGIKIIPNPSTDKITISVPNGVTIDEVVIYNQTGQKVLQRKPINNTLDISKLQHGMYIVELKTDQGKIRGKLIVQ
jgi:hypothetical protein